MSTTPAQLRILAQGIVAASTPPARRSLCFPTFCITPRGRWLVAYRAAPAKYPLAHQTIELTWSDDQGHTWTKPLTPFTAPLIAGKQGTLRTVGLTPLADGRIAAILCWVEPSTLPYFNEATEGLLDSQPCLSFSSDEGATWTTPVHVNTAPYLCPVPPTGPMVQLPTGELVLQFELNKTHADPAPWHHASVLMFSTDGGRTWPRHCRVAEDPDHRIFYWDQRLSVLPDGRLLDLFWTFDRQAGTYLQSRVRASHDAGRTWSPMWELPITQQPAPLVPLTGSALGLIYTDRRATPALKMRRSTDAGQTWPAHSEITLWTAPPTHHRQRHTHGTMQDAWADMASFSAGWPDPRPLALPGPRHERDAVIIFYAGSHPDQTDIRWIRVGDSSP